MSFQFEINHTLTELQLILQVDDCEGNFLPFQQIPIDNDMPIFFDNQIRIATWKHVFESDMIPFDQIDPNMFVHSYFRCAVPIDGFFYLNRLLKKDHYYETNKSIFFAIAICNNDNNFDFVSVQTDVPFMPHRPLLLGINDINAWFGPSWDSVCDNVNLDFMEIVNNVQQDTAVSFYFPLQFDEIKNARKKLNKKLKKISPKINQIL